MHSFEFWKMLYMIIWISIFYHVKGNQIDTRPYGRIRIPNGQIMTEMNSKHTFDINLPIGFSPQPPPQQPPFYPFDFHVGTQPSHIPFLQKITQANRIEGPNEPIKESMAFEDILVPGQIKETIVYGQRKSEHPMKPHEIYESPGVFRQRVENMSNRVAAPDIQRKSDNFELSHSQELGSIKISTNSKSFAIHPAPMIVNQTSRSLSNFFKQMSDLIETATFAKSTDSHSTASTWIPLIPSTLETKTKFKIITTTTEMATTETTSDIPNLHSTPKETILNTFNWPVDFIESTTTNLDSLESDSEQYPLKSEQMYSELSVGESQDLPSSVNISQVGVPYEENNFGKESVICVPLTVMEKSESSRNSASEAKETQRIYCFPLPNVENENATKTNQTNADKDIQTILSKADLNITSSKATHLNKLGTLSVLYVVLHTWLASK